MKRCLQIVRTAGVALVLFALLATVVVTSARAEEQLNYKGMVEEIGAILNESLDLYKKGKGQEAKLRAQAAYLEVFENLEGPIRINISAKKNYELEQEFILIRKMIVEKQPAEAIEKKIAAFMADLKSTTAKLEGGYELIAEASDDADAQQDIQGGAGGAGAVELVWQQSFNNIEAKLSKALETYRNGDAKGAAELVIQTQYDDYKNSLFETAVRRHKSLKKDYENNSGFTGIATQIQAGAAPEKVALQVDALITGLSEDLMGLPLVDGASADKGAATAEPSSKDQDWTKVNANIFAEIEKAIELYQKGDVEGAVELVQNVYFDIFESSGMEGKIGARDANFKAKLEAHINMLISQMKAGVPVETVQGNFAALKADFKKAAEMLGGGADSPMALFLYSLMIILREGIEAILIITAIIAYLVKSGNRDKLKVIYNGCIAALVLSVLTALLVKWVFKISAASQEALEGGTMLLASLVLFSVSYWLISKAESQKWVTYIKDKVGDSLSSRSLKTLWFAAFLAVYREGAETVLFYQALASGASASGLTAVAGGFVVGSILLVAIYLGMRYGALKLPIRPFFLCTGILLYYMAFVFVGNGMMELIEAKMVQSTLVSWMPSVGFMGIHPYLQTLVPQLLMILAALVALVMLAKQRAIPAPQSAEV